MHETIIVAGTFDRLHEGHFLLFHAAFYYGNHVEIWVTDDKIASVKGEKVSQQMLPYTERCNAIAQWCDLQTQSTLQKFQENLNSFQKEGGSTELPAISDDRVRSNGESRIYSRRYSFHELHDMFGDSIVNAQYDSIVCSEETRVGCEMINTERIKLGMNPLEIYVVSILLNPFSHQKLSSTDIRATLKQRTS
jgi:phosphopantetheine adenylyltransferase